MIKILLDNDIAGFQTHLAAALKSLGWSEYQVIEFVSLSEVGLARETTDREIWRFCQRHSLILLTGNRNRKDPNSLAQTIRDENTFHALPVVTISQQKRLHNAVYREACVERLVAIVLELHTILGTGRLFIP